LFEFNDGLASLPNLFEFNDGLAQHLQRYKDYRVEIIDSLKRNTAATAEWKRYFQEMCMGALPTWKRFAADQLPGGANFDPAPKLLRTLKITWATNQASEGAIGKHAQTGTGRPNISELTRSSLVASHFNQPLDFLQTLDLTEEARRRGRPADEMAVAG
jgi:hypothetical protein